MPEPQEAVRAYSRRFDNLYLFITERCQLRCKHCYMGDRLARGLEMDGDRCRAVLGYFSRLGARFVTLVGGEPTLHPELVGIIAAANELNYEKVMVDTNGHRPETLVGEVDPKSLFYVRVSLDGASAASHDRVRGRGAFAQATAGLRRLVEAGFSVRITSTVFTFNEGEVGELVRLGEELGASLVNFHSFSPEGLGAERGSWRVAPAAWRKVCAAIEEAGRRSTIPVRYPPTWADADDLEGLEAAGFRGCLGASLDRISVFPDGRCQICPAMLDGESHFASLAGSSGPLALRQHKGNELGLFLRAVSQALRPTLSGCPAEPHVPGDGESAVIPVCRLWRKEVR